jgi:hypothetical protein
MTSFTSRWVTQSVCKPHTTFKHDGATASRHSSGKGLPEVP